MADKQESKHRPVESLKFVKLLYKDVFFYRDLSDEEVGKRIKDLIKNMVSLEKSEYPENNAAIDEAQYYVERRREKIAEWRQKKKEAEALTG